MGATARSRTGLQRQTIAGQIADALRERILAGDLDGGVQLRQDALAAEYDVSRIPVREALRRLEAEGLVELHAHRGAVVTELSTPEIAELFEIRAMLEPPVLARAVPRLAEGDFAEAERVLGDFGQALAAEDVTVWGRLNWRFHSTLYAPADRPRTLAIIKNLHDNTDRYSRMQMRLTRWTDRAQEEHRRLLALSRERDAAAAASFLERHIRTAGHALVDYLTEHRQRRHA